MADYENLGFQVNVDSDSAVSRLDEIIKKLEKIQTLEGKSIKPTSTSGTSQQLSEIEKYEKRVAKSSELLSTKKYEELRKTELLNKERQKEIDQRLKQELGIKDTTNSLGKFVAKLTSVVVIAKRIGRFISSAIQESAEYTENLNLFAVAFGKTYQQQLDWAIGIAEAYGLANNEVLKFAGTFRELSASLGIVGDTADTVTKVVTNLGYDLSALFNTTVEQAMEKLQSGIFSGNVRPLRAYGIDISQNQINALFETNDALRQLNVNAQGLSQSEKVIARLIIALQSGKDSFGTMAREINNLQSQFRIFQGSVDNLKLALGDLVQGPLSSLMVFVNAFVIALTNIIRKIVPLTTTDATPKAIVNTAESAETANEELDKLNSKLASFDKFNVLQQSGGESSSLAVTEALNQLLQEQANLYNSELNQALKNMTNQATELAEVIEPLVGFSTAFISVWAASSVITAISNIGKLKEAISILTNSQVGLNKGLTLTRTLMVGTIIYSLVEFIQAIERGDTAVAILSGAVIVLAGVFLILDLRAKSTKKSLVEASFGMQSLDKTTKLTAVSVGMLATGLSVAVMGFASFISQWGNMGDAQKAIGIIVALTGAVVALGIALHATKGDWVKAIGIAGMVAGGALSVTAALPKFAEGGYTNANLIMTHENGKREWVGKAAGSSAIVNDTQMSDIMEVAVAKGVYQALTARSAMGSATPSNETIVVKIGEEAVFNAVRKTAKRQGKDFASV